MATGKIPEDPRIDPRIKALFGSFPEIPTEDVVSREAMLAEANSDEAKAREQAMQAFFEMCDNEDICAERRHQHRYSRRHIRARQQLH